jgi:Tol biopolymer transport system component/imidazolonepropionase-like amidohydrolase
MDAWYRGAAPIIPPMFTKTIAIAVLFAAGLGSAQAEPAEKKDAPAKKDVAADINAPRADARKVSFEAKEGTWISVDLSPDGQTVVFDLLGDLYLLPVAGGAARAITSGPGWDSQPRFSPDGKTIAFTSDRGGIENIWLVGADGQNARALTEEKDSYVRTAAWTPDGQYVVARKEEGKRAGIPPVELWLYHREGGSGVKLTSSDDINNASGPAPSRDGRWIYFSARSGRFNYIPDLSSGLWQVRRFDRTTGDVYQVTEGVGGGVRPQPSPDGRWLSYLSRRDDETVIVLRDLQSGAEKIVARDVTRDEQEGFAQMDLWPGYAFTPDGRALVFSNHGRIVRLELESGQSREVPFVAKVEQSMAPRVTWQEKLPTGPVAARILRRPTASPDGKLLAFDAFGRVWLQDLAPAGVQGAPRRLTQDSPARPAREYGPAFSPDGRWIAYATWSDREGGHLWKAPVGGGEPQRLTRTPGHYANPTWSAQGDRLSLVRGSGLEFRGRQPEEENLFELHWIDAGGGDTHYVTAVSPSNWRSYHPQGFWNEDGSRLLFREGIEPKKPTDDPKTELVSVRLDGTDKKRLLRLPVVSELVPSPDARWVVFTSRDNVYVAAVPPVQTKEPAEVSLKEGSVPVWRLSREAGTYVAWTDGGKTVTWALGPTFHRLPLEEAVKFADEQRRKAEAEKKAAAAGGDDKKDDKKKAGAEKKAGEDEDELKLPKAQTFTVALTLPRPLPSGSFVLKGARVVTMKGREVLENTDVVVTGNRIAAVGPSGTVTVPAGARTFEAAGKTVIPGLIDTHAHLHYSAFETFPETKWEYAANLAYGVTTVYDPSAPTIDVFAQAEMVEAGLMVGPRVFSSGDVLYGGQPFDIFAEVENEADARRQVRRMKAYGARMIKVYQQPRRSQRIYFAEAARKEKMLLTAEGAGEYQTDLTMALDGYTAFEHSLPVELREDAVQLLARSGTHYTPTLLVSYGGPWGELYFYQQRNPHDDSKLNRFVPHFMLDRLGRRHPWIWPEEYHFPTVAQGAAQVARAGGKVSLGAHGQLQGLGVHWELWAMAGEGAHGDRKAMTPHEALEAATLAAADKIGFAPDLGSVEVGKRADLMVLDADPLADIHNTEKVSWVVKDGVVYDAASLKELWPGERELPAFFWRDSARSAPR